MASAVNDSLDSLTLVPASAPPCLFLDEIGLSDQRQSSGARPPTWPCCGAWGCLSPEAFVCTVRACRLFLEEAGIEGGIRRALRDAELGRIGLGEAAAAIRDMIMAAPLPPALERALVDNRSRLTADGCGVAVSVRSSGVAEDGTAYSFARRQYNVGLSTWWETRR